VTSENALTLGDPQRITVIMPELRKLVPAYRFDEVVRLDAVRSD